MGVGTAAFVLVGLAGLAAGGELLVRGAGGLARSLGMSSLVVGLTVVSLATSAPELAVTLGATRAGSPGLAVGNVVGSNVANILLVLGVSAAAAPLVVRSQVVRADIPVMIALSVAVLLLALDGSVSRVDGVLLVLALVVYLTATVVIARSRHRLIDTTVHLPPRRRLELDVLLVALGLGLLVGGARLLVGGATDFAEAAGVSDLVIGLTVVAIGTSLPELATSLIAVARGERELALGNVVGSNTFNIGAVLGISAIAARDGIPVASAAIRLDLPIMLAVAIVLLPLAITGFEVARWEGMLLAAYYVAYILYVLLDATRHDAVGPYSAVMLGFVIPATVLWLATLVVFEARSRRAQT